MAFRFKRASCVVVGTFNMYIIQPSWLAKIGLYPKATTFAIYAKFDEPGSRFAPQEAPTHKWTVSPNRIDIETEAEHEDCGEKIATVLAKLPETPLKAIGNNYIYEAPLSELGNLKDFACFDPAVPAGYEVRQRSFHLGLTHEEQQFNLQLSVTREVIELSVNVHTDFAGIGSEHAPSVARRFAQQREQAEFLVTSILKVGVEHDTGNSQAATGSNGRPPA